LRNGNLYSKGRVNSRYFSTSSQKKRAAENPGKLFGKSGEREARSGKKRLPDDPARG